MKFDISLTLKTLVDRQLLRLPTLTNFKKFDFVSGHCDDNNGKSKMSQINTLKLVHGRNKATTCDIFQYGATVISWKV